MSVLAKLQCPDSVVLTLRTLTPLYTGGVGQHGDQLHPSGLLGGLRRFSCLLAAAVGDTDFEYAVWGTPTDAKNHHAKRIGLRLDPTGLEDLRPVAGKGLLNWPRSDDQPRQGWYYNVAREGTLRLTITRRGIRDAHWQQLLLALRIQIRHATSGARDQWGFGVLATDALPAVAPLAAATGDPLPDRPGLHHACFAEVRFDNPPPPHWPDRLEQGLRWREKLRGSLRQPGMDELRHYVFGQLNRHGNAINVSALYPQGQGCALRVWGVVPHTTPLRFVERRGQVMPLLQQALQQGPAQPWPGPRRVHWQDFAEPQQALVDRINTLAGVTA